MAFPHSPFRWYGRTAMLFAYSCWSNYFEQCESCTGMDLKQCVKVLLQVHPNSRVLSCEWNNVLGQQTDCGDCMYVFISDPRQIWYMNDIPIRSLFTINSLFIPLAKLFCAVLLSQLFLFLSFSHCLSSGLKGERNCGDFLSCKNVTICSSSSSSKIVWPLLFFFSSIIACGRTSGLAYVAFLIQRRISAYFCSHF